MKPLYANVDSFSCTFYKENWCFNVFTCGEAQVIEWQELLFFFFLFLLLGFTICRESSQKLTKSPSNLSKLNMEDF